MTEPKITDIPDITYVFGLDGNPRMSTTRKRHVFHLLKIGKARIVEHVPFTIQLLYKDTGIVQPLMLGIDPGRTNIGVTVVREDGEVVFTGEVHTRNKQIPKLMKKRRVNRRTSRTGLRKVRQRLAKRYKTVVKGNEIKRHLPQYGKDKYVTCKYIRNKEARFCNRKRPRGWLTPSAEQLVRTHVYLVHKLQKFLPITDVCLEVNRFAFASMENPDMEGVDFQNGPLKGFDDVNDAVFHRQNGICLLCKKKGIKHYHHVIPQHEGGSNTMPNIAGLCEECHTDVHQKPEVKVKLSETIQGINKKYGALSILNQSIPYIYKRLLEELGKDHLYVTFGKITYRTRNALQFTKTKENQVHYIDAYCIALHGLSQKQEVKLLDFSPEIKVRKQDFQLHIIQQFRRHDRARINAQFERTYKQQVMENGKLKWKTVAKNRKPRFEQDGPSLQDWFQEQCDLVGKREARKQMSALKVCKSHRSYNNKNRILPGTIFEYEGKQYILGGQQNKGVYYYPYEENGNKIRFLSKKCTILKQNSGLVFLN